MIKHFINSFRSSTILTRQLASKFQGFVSYSSGRNVKVFISRKENYADHESPYYDKPKPVESWVTNFYAVANREWTFKDVLHWIKKREKNKIIEDQKFCSERYLFLGPNLSAAHFLTARGAKVKFAGSDKWFTYTDIEENRLPSRQIPGFYVEEIDASNTYLCYEGLENLYNLRSLKKLILRNCEFVDDWCLHRMQHFRDTVRYIDLSGCQQVSERGISSLHVLKKLETLVIEDNPNIQNKELVCLLLQDFIPKCKIIGVDFDNPILLKRLESYMT